jgi:tetratricopeptide (TPR) repeat protein
MSAKTPPAAPYAGLRPYSEDDAPFFFGRERVKESIIDNLKAKRLTLVYGASGVGKSSVLRAGVEYQLRRLAQENLELKGTPLLAVAVFQEWQEWSNDPMSGLLACVQESVKRTLGDPTVELTRSSNSLAEDFQQLAARVGGDLLIILDQFEDYFLYHRQEAGDGTFLDEFQRMVNRPDLRVNFVLSVRDDAYSKLEHFKDDVPSIFDNSLRIDHLNAEAAREAISEPIERYNRFYASGSEHISVEPELVEEVLRQVRTGNLSMAEGAHDVVTEPNGATEVRNTIETPFLQLVMTELWNAEMLSGSTVLRRRTLEHLGGAKTIVATHLRKALERLSETEKALAASAFGYLVTPSGDKRAYTAFDIAESAGLDRHQLPLLLEKLSRGNNRILRSFASPDRRGESSYEIFHDVLAEPIVDWRRQYNEDQRRKEEKRKADEELAETKRRAEEEKKLAAASARADEQAKVAAVLRLKNRALAAATAVAVIAALIAAWQYVRAERARHQAVVAGNVHSAILAGLYPLLLQSDDHEKAIHDLQATLDTLNEVRERYRQENTPVREVGEGIALNNIGGLYRSIGEAYAGSQDYERSQDYYKQSEEKYGEALALLEDGHVLGPSHPDVATSLNDLAILWSNRGEATKAEQLFERALTILENALGRYDRFVADADVNLANCYFMLGKYADAESLYGRALKIRKKELPPVHPELARSLSALAWLYVEQGRYAEAEPLFKDALANWQAGLESERSNTAICFNGLAAIYRQRGEYPEAAEYLKQAVYARKDLIDKPENGLMYAEAEENLALLYEAQNDLKAESVFLDALQRRKNGLGDKHPDTAYTEGKLASFYYKQRKYAEAEQYFKSALEIQKGLPGSTYLAQSLYGLGRLYTDQEKYVEAEPLLKQALEIQERAIPKHPDFADTLDGYADLLSKTDRQTAAVEARTRAERIRQIHREENPNAR